MTKFWTGLGIFCAFALAHAGVQPASQLRAEWLARWQRSILAESRNRYCDRENGEEIGWLVSPFLNGYYYGYLATGDTAWIDRLLDWTGALKKRMVREPDGFYGWPKIGTGGVQEEGLYTDSLLGEAMAFRPIVMASKTILDDRKLKARYGEKAIGNLKLAEDLFRKWTARGCWREAGNYGLWVVPGFGIDPASKGWTSGYTQRATLGFSNPDNKQNLIAEWVLALYDATKRPAYRSAAEKWWRTMKSRMTLREGRFYVWSYWSPGGPWDYKPDGSTRHWVGTHPNGGYYAVDVGAFVDAYRHGIVFTRADIDRLIATNRDYMWDGKVSGARFKSIGGGRPDARWPNTAGVVWTELALYDRTLKTVFEANFDPSSWGGIATTPWYLAATKEGR